MCPGGSPWNDKGMSPAYVPDVPKAYPSFVRPTDHRTVAGVAAGLATHLRIDVLYVRITLAVLSLLSGLGLMAYVAVWIFTPTSPTVPPPPDRRQWSRSANTLLAIAVVFLGMAAAALVSGLAPVLWPLVIVGLGAFLAWHAYDRGTATKRGAVSLTIGAGLVVGGLGMTILWWDTGGMAGSLTAVILTLTGVVVLAGPAVLRLWESAAQSRAEKVAAEERAEIASRLHDSVLQTLALIQKRADDPGEVARLARGQERELRGWLFDAEEKTVEQTVFGAVAKAAGEVEDMFGIRITPVTVGQDQLIDENSQALVMAAREAMVNAAKHAGVDTLDVYAELFGSELSIYVRDRGRGFDPTDVPEDRHGIRDSIYARAEKAGGEATIQSAPGEGTEVVLTLSCDV